MSKVLRLPRNLYIDVQAPITKSQQILRAGAVEMHFEDLQGNECPVYRSELAANGDEHLDQTPVLNTYRKNP